MSILDYLDKNKEWLFSGGGVVAIALVLTGLRDRIFPKKNLPTAIVSPRQEDQTPSQLSQSQTAQVTRTHSVELSEIISALNKSPPLQKADLIKHYIGLSVQWESQLFNAEKKDEDNVRVVLDFGSRNLFLVYCSVRLADYRELGVMERGTPVTVIGEISELSTSSASLENVQLFFHGSSSTAG